MNVKTHNWYLTIDSYLGGIGRVPVKSYPFVVCVFVSRCGYLYVSEHSTQPAAHIADGHNNFAAILALYVDEMILPG